MAEKSFIQSNVVESSLDIDSREVIRNNGTNSDAKDMLRMGKKQELRRGFGLIAMVGFVTLMQSSWESTLLASSFGLLNGGTAGVIWCTTAVWLCVMALTASMAEMASMAPTAGGQYHWVSEFAPSSWQQPLSYVVGWACCLGWVSAIPACGQMLSGLIQGMVLLVNPDSNFGALWQTTLLIFLVVVLAIAFNMYFAKHLATVEIGFLVIHSLAFVAFLGVLWASPNLAPAKEVFTHAVDGGGWGNIGLSTLVGISTPLWCFVAPDAGAHMSEELKDASLTLPRAMMWSTFFGGTMGIAMLITLCFCIGDISDVINSPTGIPIIQVLYNSSQSYTTTCVMATILAVLTMCGAITGVAAVSRQCWAFARDYGFPFSAWLSRVRPLGGVPVPVNSMLMCLAISLILASINFGSDVALNAIISVSNAALVFSYFVSLGCLRLKRWRGEPLLPARWSLGRLGAPVNDLALVFLAVSFVFSFFPETPLVGDPTWAADFNWAIVMWAATCFLALVYYYLGGKQLYVPPVRLVRKEAVVEDELSSSSDVQVVSI